MGGRGATLREMGIRRHPEWARTLPEMWSKTPVFGLYSLTARKLPITNPILEDLRNGGYTFGSWGPDFAGGSRGTEFQRITISLFFFCYSLVYRGGLLYNRSTSGRRIQFIIKHSQKEVFLWKRNEKFRGNDVLN